MADPKQTIETNQPTPIDNTAYIEQIKTSIADIKKSVEELSKRSKDFEEEKKTLQKDLIEERQKELDTKKADIEKKKQSTQELINKIRKERIDLKLENLDDETKKSLEQKKTQEEYLLTIYEKDLQSIQPNKEGRIKKQRNALTSKEEWKNHPRENVGRTALGIGAVVGTVVGTVVLVSKAWKWIFGDKKNEEKKDGENKEKKKNGFRKKILLAGGGVLGGVLVWKNRGTISDRFKSLFGGKQTTEEEHIGTGEDSGDLITDNEGTIENYLKNPHKGEYDNLATIINQYHANINPSAETNEIFGKGNIDIGNPGIAVWAMDNSYKNVGAILSEKGVYQEGELSGDVKLGKWLKSIWGAPYYKSMIYLLGVGSSVPVVGSTFQKLKNAKEEDLENLAFTDDDIANCKEVFNKNKIVFNYLSDKKSLLRKKLIEQKLTKIGYEKTTKAEYDKLSTEEQQKLIDKIKSNKEYMKDIDSYVETKFSTVAIWQATQNLTTIQYDPTTTVENLNDEELSDETEDVKEGVMQEKEDLMKDVDLEEAAEKVENGTFDRDGDKDELENIADTFLDKYIEGDGLEYTQREFFSSRFGHIPELRGSTAFEKERFFKDKKLDIKLLKMQTSIKLFQNKLKNKTATKQDIEGFKKTIDDYFNDRIDWETSLMNIEQVKKENGNLWVRVKRFTGGTWTDTVDLCFKGDFERSTPTSLVLTTLMLWPAGKAMNKLGSVILKIPGGGVLTKAAGLAIKVPGRLIDKTIGKGYDKLIGRRIPFLRNAYYTGEDGMKLLKMDFWKGRVSLKRAMDLSRSTSELQFLNSVYGAGAFDGVDVPFMMENNILENTKLRRELFEMQGVFNRYPKSRLDALREVFKSIDKVGNDELKVILKTALRNTSDYKKTTALMEETIRLENGLNKGSKLKLFKYVGKGPDKIMSAEKFGIFLGENASKVAKIQKMDTFLEFVAKSKAAGKIKDIELFMKNSVSSWKAIEKVGYDISQIEKLGLNISKYEKVATKIKAGVSNMINDLGGFLKNPKMAPFYNGIKTKIIALKEYAQTVTPDSLKAMKEMNRLDKVTGFSKLTPKGIAALGELNILLKGEKGAEILKSLKGVKGGADEVRAVIKAADIENKIDVAAIDEGVLLKIAKTKNISKIRNIVNYGAEFKSISVLKKIISNPGMRAFGRWLGYVGAGIELGFSIYEFGNTLKESAEIKKYNMERGENKESEAYFDVITGGMCAVAGGCACIPGIGRIASAALFATSFTMMGVKEIGDRYYDEIDKFRQNYQDFLKKDLPAIKQNLIYVNNRQAGLDSSFQDIWSHVTGNLNKEEKTKVSVNTSADAVKAIIYFEELQKFPDAIIDLNRQEVLNDPMLQLKVEEQKRLHAESVEERYQYIKQNYIDGKKQMIPEDKLKNNQGIQSLDDILQESRIYQTVQKDENYQDKTKIKEYKKYLEDNLVKGNPSAFTKLEGLFKTNKLYIFEKMAEMQYYKAKLVDLNGQEDSFDLLSTNAEFFEQYFAYKTLGTEVSTWPMTNVDPKKVDYREMEAFLTGFGITAAGFTEDEVTQNNGVEGVKAIEYLDEAQVNAKYNVSTILGQNVLYEIANKQLGYVGANKLDNLKAFYSEDKKEVHGIYFDPSDKDRAINENNGSDNEFATDEQLNSTEAIKKMREYINDAGTSGGTGKMIVESSELNIEYCKKMVDIIDQELDFRLNDKKYKQEIMAYIRDNSKGQYIELDPDSIIKGTKAGIRNIGAFVYYWDGKKADAKTDKPGLTLSIMDFM